MRGFSMIAAAAALVATSGVPIAAPADAHPSKYRHHHYHGRTIYAHRTCRWSRGTAGMAAGGVGGAVVGSQLIGHGLIGVAAGAVGGAVAGRAIDRSMTAHRRCYVRR
jgi:outer membrane lipoprotein SlyB